MVISRVTLVHIVASPEVGDRERVVFDLVRYAGGPGALL
jgi:hypothetical protein